MPGLMTMIIMKNIAMRSWNVLRIAEYMRAWHTAQKTASTASKK